MIEKCKVERAITVGGPWDVDMRTTSEVDDL